jgi:hypothetical protein
MGASLLRIPLLLFMSIVSQLAYCQADWLVLKSPDHKFWLTYPPDWMVITADTPNSIGAVLSPKGKFMGMCTVGIARTPQTGAKAQEQLNKEMDAVEMKPSDWLQRLEGTFPDVKILETAKIRIQNQPAHLVVMESGYQNVGRKTFVHNVLVTTLTPGLVWNLGCGTVASSARKARDGFGYWRPIFQGILRGFIFPGPGSFPPS